MNLIARIAWGVLALATVAVAAAAYVVELPEPENAIAVDHATYVDAGGSVQRITLPYTSAFRSWEQPGTVRYLAHFDLAAKPDRPLFLHVPAVNRQMSLSLNGGTLNGGTFFDGGNRAFLAGPLVSASVFVPLPDALLTVGGNEVALAVETGRGALSLHISRIYVGTEAQLMPNVRLRGFL